METIKFKNGVNRHVYFKNGFVFCVETGLKAELPKCYKTFGEWVSEVKSEIAIGKFEL
jgi:hypothetical protein